MSGVQFLSVEVVVMVWLTTAVHACAVLCDQHAQERCAVVEPIQG